MFLLAAAVLLSILLLMQLYCSPLCPGRLGDFVFFLYFSVYSVLQNVGPLLLMGISFPGFHRRATLDLCRENTLLQLGSWRPNVPVQGWLFMPLGRAHTCTLFC